MNKRSYSKIVLSAVLILLIGLLVGVWAAGPADVSARDITESGAAVDPPPDIPPPYQFPGEHSTLTTWDGSIRDDELADYICSKIPKDPTTGAPLVHDVKIMFNSCYGGGMLDDFGRVFGPGGACEGVPWVGSSASGPNEVAYGPSNAAVNENPGANLGSRWTNALDDAIKAGGNVKSSFETARDNDKAGPNGYKGENPVIASGNGGSGINWNDADKHHAVVFGGKNNKLRHDNNIENVGAALGSVFGDDLTYIGNGWGDASTGTESHLKGLIDAATSGLDADTQLVLYFDDHGDTDFDIDEFLGWISPQIIYEPTPLEVPLHEGWVPGLTAMDLQPGDIPAPVLIIDLDQSVPPGTWQFALNGVPIPMPPDPMLGEVILPVQWNSIISGTNLLELNPLAHTSPPLLINNLELGSGPINEIEDNDVPAPSQLPGEHSTLTTWDGSIRDDELADYVCSQIPKDPTTGVPLVHDVKIMFNSCYGGGMLDDFERVFGPGGACEGVPWVAGAASGPNEVAYGPSNTTVNNHPGENLGSRWTNALDDAIKAGGNVQDSFKTARDNDKAGPNGYKGENPVVASGNGGSSVNWNDADKHRAVVFGGWNNALRHNNNIENVSDALGDVFGASLTHIGKGWGNAATGTEASLKSLITAAATGLDADTQLVLYFDDHGDTDFDFDEFFDWVTYSIIPSSPPTVLDFPLHGGWVTGLTAMDEQPGDIPAPVLILETPLIITTDWQLNLNGSLVPLPAGPVVSGEMIMEVQWDSIISGTNTLTITSLNPSSPFPMQILNMELGSGPINEINDWELYLPVVVK